MKPKRVKRRRPYKYCKYNFCFCTFVENKVYILKKMTPIHAKFVSVTTLVLAVGNIVMLPQPLKSVKNFTLQKTMLILAFIKHFHRNKLLVTLNNGNNLKRIF